MKSILFVTFIDFWASGAGHRSRLSAMIKYMRGKVKITVAFLGPLSLRDEDLIRVQFPYLNFIILEKRRFLSYREYGYRLQAVLEGLIFDATIIEYLELSFLLNFIDNPGKKVLDLHDIVSDKIEMFKKFNIPYNGIQISRNEEFELYREFDYILAIQSSDKMRIGNEIGESRTILVHHSVNFKKQKLRTNLNILGFVGSEYLPNVDGILFFITEIWYVLYKEFALELRVFGNVCQKLSEKLSTIPSGITLCGFVEEISSVYNQCDLMINPVRAGAGLKIKNVEAIGNGLPLITTSHGAIGFEYGIGNALLVADNLEAWLHYTHKLMNFDFRQDLADRAYTYSQEHFSEEACFSKFMKIIMA